RRNFLKFCGVGFFSSLTLNPFFEKSIFALEEKGQEAFKTRCSLCSFGCGMEVKIKGGKIAEIEGLTGDPESLGHLCQWGSSLKELIYHPKRVLKPLKRKGEKGKGEFTTISWEEALSIIRDKWFAIIREEGPEAIACYLGENIGLEAYFLLPRLFYSMGSPNLFSPALSGQRGWGYGGYFTVGEFPCFNLEDIKRAKCLIFWGYNPNADTSPGIQEIIKQKAKENVKIITIDPKKVQNLNNQIWIPMLPGYDGLLAWSMAQVIIKEGLYDNKFIEDWGWGFEGFKDIALKSEYSPDTVGKRLGIPPEKIKSIAITYAKEKPALILGGRGVSMHSSGVQNSRAIHNLIALTGNINRQGGNSYYTFPLNPLKGYLSLEDRLKIDDRGKKQLVVLPVGFSDTNRLWDLLNADGDDNYWREHIFRCAISEKRTPYNLRYVYQNGYQGSAYKIRSLLCAGANPLLVHSNTLKGKTALKKLNFLVCIANRIDNTGAYADIILPQALCLEADQIVGNQWPSGNSYLKLSEKVIPPAGECLPLFDTICRLGNILGYKKEFDTSFEGIIDKMGEENPGSSKIKHQRLKSSPIKALPLYSHQNLFPHPHYKKFNTPAGKVMFRSETLAELGFNPYPEFVPPVESKEKTPTLADKFPLILTMGMADLKKEEKTSDIRAELNPFDAEKYNIKEGDMIFFETKTGREGYTVKLNADLKQGVVWILSPSNATKGIFTNAGKMEQNAFVLVNDAYNDPICGAEPSKEMLVRIKSKA
ncbi:MAG: molybdopterin-dependent oxidoreductase, partial [Thermodesulfobacteriota bacterium]|nr:molybdopterin-dependent oxidoreductase [Thermodesulfobacteriota bacterium]